MVESAAEGRASDEKRAPGRLSGPSGSGRFWPLTLTDTASGEPLLPALNTRASLGDTALTPDGATLVVVAAEPDVYLWPLSIDRWVEQACRIAGRVLTESEWERYLPGQGYHPGCGPDPDRPAHGSS
jgi:hypothetical protein